jgi:hypothetical protein
MRVKTMFDPTLENTLYSELSDNQQEAIAGGGQLEDIHKTIFTTFDASETIFKNVAGSGANGSTVVTELSNKSVKTAAYEDLCVGFDTAPIVLGNHSWGM